LFGVIGVLRGAVPIGPTRAGAPPPVAAPSVGSGAARGGGPGLTLASVNAHIEASNHTQ
jgi:hypothetical protein